jgi:hypothetical protein
MVNLDSISNDHFEWLLLATRLFAVSGGDGLWDGNLDGQQASLGSMPGRGPGFGAGEPRE